MKNLILILIASIHFVSCNNSSNNSNLKENKVSQSEIKSSADSHSATQCPILNGLYQSSFRKGDVVSTTYWLYQTQFDSSGAIYSIKQSTSDGAMIGSGNAEIVRADGKMYFRNHPDQSKAWIHSCINKGLVIDFLNENKSFEVYAKQEIMPSTVIAVMALVQTSLTEETGVLDVSTGSFALIK